MPGRTPTEAYFDVIDPIHRALNLVTVGRLSVGLGSRGLRIGVPASVALNDNDPAVLKSSVAGRILLTVGLRLVITRMDAGHEPFSGQLVGYWYTISTSDDRELVSFHWTPEVPGNQRTYPHLHVGSIVTAGSRVAPDTFNKLHIPTSQVPPQAFVRFAIEELGVEVRPGLDQAAALRALS